MFTWQRRWLHPLICRVWKHHVACKHYGSMFDRTGVIADRIFCTVGTGIFDLLAPVTLTLTRWPSYMNSTHRPWRSTTCANTNFVHHGFWKLSSDRHTYTTKITYDATSRVVQNANDYNVTNLDSILLPWHMVADTMQFTHNNHGRLWYFMLAALQACLQSV